MPRAVYAILTILGPPDGSDETPSAAIRMLATGRSTVARLDYFAPPACELRLLAWSMVALK